MFHVSELSALLLVILHAFSTSLWVKVEFHPNGIATAAIIEKTIEICGSLESHSLIPKTSCQESQTQSNISEQVEPCILIHLHSCTLHMHDKKQWKHTIKACSALIPKLIG